MPWAKTGASSPYYEQTLTALAKHYKVSMETPWDEAAQARAARHPLRHRARRRSPSSTRTACANSRRMKAFEGVIGNIERRWRETDSEWVREELARYQDAHPCEACGGYRLKPQALAVKIGGKHIGEVGDLSIKAANVWFAELPKTAHQEAERDRDAHPEGDPRAACSSSTTSASNTSRCRAARARCRAARASASGSPRRSAPASPACSTCSTSRRSGCISATTSACSARSSTCATSATP